MTSIRRNRRQGRNLSKSQIYRNYFENQAQSTHHLHFALRIPQLILKRSVKKERLWTQARRAPPVLLLPGSRSHKSHNKRRRRKEIRPNSTQMTCTPLARGAAKCSNSRLLFLSARSIRSTLSVSYDRDWFFRTFTGNENLEPSGFSAPFSGISPTGFSFK